MSKTYTVYKELADSLMTDSEQLIVTHSCVRDAIMNPFLNTPNVINIEGHNQLRFLEQLELFCILKLTQAIHWITLSSTAFNQRNSIIGGDINNVDVARERHKTRIHNELLSDSDLNEGVNKTPLRSDSENNAVSWKYANYRHKKAQNELGFDHSCYGGGHVFMSEYTLLLKSTKKYRQVQDTTRSYVCPVFRYTPLYPFVALWVPMTAIDGFFNTN